ncbi:hypothetical protein ACSFXN_10900 [Planococcus sp. 1R117A]|uniref:hypothetical protein n=1 Tax=Planococcus sp. 1R117A TaxID=3447020 RepID=UPI003EDBDE0E
MSFKAEVLNVFIASPFDVHSRRDEIELAILQWNKEHAKDLQTILLPRRWESDVAPGYNSKDAQQVINQNLLNNCDLLIGVFWTKLGTPTTNFPSGTLEEIETFHAQGKDVMVYFVDDDLPTTTNLIEFQKVKDFKEVFRVKNLAFNYDRNRIASDLLLKIREYAHVRGAIELESNVQDKIEAQENTPNLAEIIDSDDLIVGEYVLLSFILQTANRFLGARWKSDETLDQIKVWEKKQFMEPVLSSNYDLVIANMAERELIRETEHTSYGNPRLYAMPMDIFRDLRNLRNDFKSKIQEVTESLIDPYPF